MDPVKVKWISHRGFKQQALENTRPAFDAAVELGFTILETDLRLTADGHIVLHHDPDLRRLAGDARVIATSTRQELEKVSLRGGHRLLFLDEFVRVYANQEWVFDIKPETGAAVLERLAMLTKSVTEYSRVPEKTRFVVWSAAHERQLRAIWPKVDIFARESACWRAGLAVIIGLPFLGGIAAGRTYSLPSRLGPIQLHTREKVATFHRRGARVLAFLPDTDVEAAAALAAGVDEILTNGRIV